MQKHLNLVDLVKSFPTNIFLQNLASIQKRTSPVKFAHLAEKSGKGSISNLSTKAARALRGRPRGKPAGGGRPSSTPEEERNHGIIPDGRPGPPARQKLFSHYLWLITEKRKESPTILH